MLSYLAVLPLALAGLVRAHRYGTWPRAMVLLAASAVLVLVAAPIARRLYRRER